MTPRIVAKTGWQVAPLAFGCMRFRDDETAVAAIHAAVELGVNYFDVAPLYGGGTAEPRLGLGLKGLKRERLILTAKSSPGNGGDGVGEYKPETGFGIRTADQARRQIERSMTILGVDHLDMYQLWACHGDAVFEEAIRPGGFMDGVMKAREEGLFDYIGLTGHGNTQQIKRYVSESPYEFDMVTLPFGLQDTSRAEAVAWLGERGIGVIGMNPLAGGRFASGAQVLRRVAEELGLESFVEAALRYVISVPGMTAALNGITLADHAREGVAACAKGSLDPVAAVSLLERVNEVYGKVKHFCTGCGYCGECTVGLRIPDVLEAYTQLLIVSMAEPATERILARRAADPTGYTPSACEACGQCEEQCPNKLPIAELMAEAAAIWPRLS